MTQSRHHSIFVFGTKLSLPQAELPKEAQFGIPAGQGGGPSFDKQVSGLKLPLIKNEIDACKNTSHTKPFV